MLFLFTICFVAMEAAQHRVEGCYWLVESDDGTSGEAYYYTRDYAASMATKQMVNKNSIDYHNTILCPVAVAIKPTPLMFSTPADYSSINPSQSTRYPHLTTLHIHHTYRCYLRLCSTRIWLRGHKCCVSISIRTGAVISFCIHYTYGKWHRSDSNMRGMF